MPSDSSSSNVDKKTTTPAAEDGGTDATDLQTTGESLPASVTPRGAPGSGPPSRGVPSQADDDGHLIELWLHGKSKNTQEAYQRDLFQFIDYVDLPLPHVRLGDLQDWADHLEARGLAPATRSRKLGTVKSLFSFGHRIGYLVYNVGAAISGPKVPNRLAERILPEEKLQRIIALEEDLRNHALLRLFYVSGGRVSEVADLRWRALQERRAQNGKITGQVTFQGKGEKTRSVLLTSATWDVLVSLSHEEMSQGFGAPDDAVFRSQKTDGPLSRSQLWRIVRGATRSAGIKEDVSPHWFRHAHASHALDRGAPAHLVQQTLGHQSLATTSRYTHARPDDSSGQYLGM